MNDVFFIYKFTAVFELVEREKTLLSIRYIYTNYTIST